MLTYIVYLNDICQINILLVLSLLLSAFSFASSVNALNCHVV